MLCMKNSSFLYFIQRGVVHDEFNKNGFNNKISVWKSLSEVFNMKSGELVAALKMFPGKHSLSHHNFVVFSSPEPKAEVSFSDHNLSVVYHCHCCFCNFFTRMSSSPELLVQFQPNLARTKHPWLKGIQMKGPTIFPRDGNNKIGKIH